MDEVLDKLYVPAYPGQGESVAPAFKQSGGRGGGGSSLPPLETAFSADDPTLNYSTEQLLGDTPQFTLQSPSEGTQFDHNPGSLEAGADASDTWWSWDAVDAEGTGYLPEYIGAITDWTMKGRGMQVDAALDFWMFIAWTPDPNKVHIGSGYAGRFTNAGAPENRLYRIDEGVPTLLASYNGTNSYHNSYDTRLRMRFTPSTGDIRMGFSSNSAGGFGNIASYTDTTYEGGKIGFRWLSGTAPYFTQLVISGLGSDDS